MRGRSAAHLGPAALALLLRLNAAADTNILAGRSFLWEVTAAGGKAYILGSLHLAREDMYPLGGAIDRAFAESRTLVVEANVVQANPREVIARAVYPDGRQITDQIADPAERGRVDALLRKHGRSLEQLNGYKPWYAAQVIAVEEMMKLGYNPRYGLDRHFIDRAGRREIIEMEGVSFQLALLDDVSARHGALLLTYSLKELERLSAAMKEMTNAWRAGDTAFLDELILGGLREEPDLEPVYERLIFERNVAMTAAIEKFLKSADTHFVVVGAAHLVGRRGIINLLKERKYGVRQL